MTELIFFLPEEGIPGDMVNRSSNYQEDG